MESCRDEFPFKRSKYVAKNLTPNVLQPFLEKTTRSSRQNRTRSQYLTTIIDSTPLPQRFPGWGSEAVKRGAAEKRCSNKRVHNLGPLNTYQPFITCFSAAIPPIIDFMLTTNKSAMSICFFKNTCELILAVMPHRATFSLLQDKCTVRKSLTFAQNSFYEELTFKTLSLIQASGCV